MVKNKTDNRKKYDWVEITKKYVNGVFESVQEFQRWVAKRKELFPEENLPSADAIWKASTKLRWAELKQKRYDKIVDKVADGAIDKEMTQALKGALRSKQNVNLALEKILIHYANNPHQMNMRANLGDVVNDLKRGIGMTTKEQQTGMGYSAPHLAGNDDENSFRKELEELDREDISKLEDLTDVEMKELESALPAEDLSFIDEGDMDE